MESQTTQLNPFSWTTLIVIGVPVTGAVILGIVALRGSDSGDRANIIQAAVGLVR
nr:hypothetical protein GCM10020063_082260 [Dactylosporangium thailandense]